MAVTNATDVFIPQIVSEHARQAFVSTSSQLMQKLVGGPGYPIVIKNDPMFNVAGQYVSNPTFKQISSLDSRIDTTSNSDVTPKKLEMADAKGVKIHRKIGPVDLAVDAIDVSSGDYEMMSAELGRQAGENMAVTVQNHILASLRGCVAGVSGTANTLTVWNASSRTNLDSTLIQRGKELLGDRANIFNGAVMHGYAHTDLVKYSLGQGYDAVGGRAHMGSQDAGGLGLVLAGCDDAQLTTADAGFDKYHTLLLGPNALTLQFTKPMVVYPEFVDLLTDQVTIRWRADYGFAVQCPYAEWDSTNGGANPTTTALATSTNWDTIASSTKEYPIVEIVHNSSVN